MSVTKAERLRTMAYGLEAMHVLDATLPEGDPLKAPCRLLEAGLFNGLRKLLKLPAGRAYSPSELVRLARTMADDTAA